MPGDWNHYALLEISRQHFETHSHCFWGATTHVDVVCIRLHAISPLYKVRDLFANCHVALRIRCIGAHGRTKLGEQELCPLFSVLADCVWFLKWWVKAGSQYLSVERNEALTHCLRIADVAWCHFRKVEKVCLPHLQLHTDFLTSLRDSATNCVLSLLNLSWDSCYIQRLLILP